MRLISQGRIPALFSLVLLGLVGCGESNESVVNKQAKETANVVVPAKEQPKTQEEYGKMRPANTRAAYKGQGYPGAK